MSKTTTAKMNSSAMTTTGPDPVNQNTIIDSADRFRERREARTARFLLIGVATATSWPSSFAHYFAGSTGHGALPVACIAAGWCGATLLLSRENGKNGWFTRHSRELLLFWDVVSLTALLSVSGGAQNPFSMLYFVPITLATVVAPARSWQVAATSVAGFLFLLLQTMEALAPHRAHPGHEHLLHHVTGMAIALAVVGAFVTYFVHHIARRLAEHKEHMLALSQQRAEDRFAVALGAFSAGAAHELGTPLGSIQLLTEELPHLDPAEQTRAITTIVSEVQRMKRLLSGLGSSDLGAEAVWRAEAWDLDELSAELAPASVRVGLSEPLSTRQPKSIVVQMVRELVRNALKETSASGVSVWIERRGPSCCIEVSDNGPGIQSTEAAELFHPFVSRTGGTGLGLFLASVHARQLGGSLKWVQKSSPGATFVLTLPLAPSLPAAVQS